MTWPLLPRAIMSAHFIMLRGLFGGGGGIIQDSVRAALLARGMVKVAVCNGLGHLYTSTANVTVILTLTLPSGAGLRCLVYLID